MANCSELCIVLQLRAQQDPADVAMPSAGEMYRFLKLLRVSRRIEVLVRLTSGIFRQAERSSRKNLIPAGISFKVSLDHAIDTKVAAARDPVKGKLVTPIRSGSKVIAPKGTAVAARIIPMFYWKSNMKLWNSAASL